MSFRNKNVKSSGFSIFEILIALFIFASTVAAVFVLMFGNQLAVIKAGVLQELLARSQFALERAKAEAVLDFEEVSSWKQTKDGFETEREVSLFYEHTKAIKTTTSSLTDKNSRPSVLSVLVSDWQSSIGQSTCYRKLPPAKKYKILGEAFSLAESMTASGVDVSYGLAYVTLESGAGNNFLIVDVRDPSDPFLFESLATGLGLNFLRSASGFVFLAANSTDSQLQVINLSDSSVSNFKITSDDPEIKDPGQGVSLHYSKNKIYLGTAASENYGPEFHILDVTVPLNPNLDWSLEIGNRVNDIVVKNNFAFLASVNPHPLRIVDLNSPQSEPIKISVDSSSNPNHSGQKLFLLDDLLVLGRSVLNPNDDYNELLVFNMKQPESPEFITGLSIKESVRDLIFREGLIIAVTTFDNENKIRFFDFQDGVLDENSFNIELPGKPTSLDCEDDIFYVVTEQPSKLVIIAPEK